MACSNITLTGINVGCKDSMGGIKEVYAIKAENVTGVTVDASTNMIDDISVTTGEKFKTYKVRKQTSSMTSTFSTDDAVGTFSIQTDLALQFTKMTTKRNEELMGLLVEDLVILAKDQNDRTWYLGKDNGVTASAGTAQTGQAMGDLNGYNVTLTDISRRLPYEVDPTILTSTLIDPAPTAE